MHKDDAVLLLLKCCRQEELGIEDPQAINLAKKLGYFPLAIEQAGGFIRTQNISIDRYIHLYEINTPELLKADLTTSHKKRFYKETVATTWKISIEEVDKRDPLAGEILRLMTFLDGAKIQKELFVEGGRSLPNNWRLATATILNVELALGCLQSYSFIRRIAENDIAIHILVQHVMRDVIGQDRFMYFEATLKLVQCQFPWGGDLSNLRTCIRYLSQGRSCAKYGT